MGPNRRGQERERAAARAAAEAKRAETEREAIAEAWKGVPITHEPHNEFKKRVPHAIGLIRTGETLQYANMILQSA